jgi:RNA polymerase sigma-B factor
MRLAVTELPEDERRIVYLRFYEGLTQAEIGTRIGTSQVQVSRRLRRIYRRLEADLEAGVDEGTVPGRRNSRTRTVS